MWCPVLFGDSEVDGALAELGPLQVVEAKHVRVEVAKVLRHHCTHTHPRDQGVIAGEEHG